MHKFQEFGPVTNVYLLAHKFCAFVTYENRNHAELAINRLYGNLYLGGKKVQLDWGRSRSDEWATAASYYPNGTAFRPTGKSIWNDKPSGNADGEQVDNDQEMPDEQEQLEQKEELEPNKLSEEDKEYLRSKGILPPEPPPMQDPVVMPAPPGMMTQFQARQIAQGRAKSAFEQQYQTMTYNYGEAHLASGEFADRDLSLESRMMNMASQYHYPQAFPLHHGYNYSASYMQEYNAQMQRYYDYQQKGQGQGQGQGKGKEKDEQEEQEEGGEGEENENENENEEENQEDEEQVEEESGKEEKEE